MTNEQYISNARSVGYDIRFTGLGMGYITLGGVKLTETKDIPEVEKDMVLLGMAIISDLVRTMPAEDFHESEAEDEDDEDWEPDITPEDYTEWCASSCGMTYNAYLGKPWLD